MSFQHLERSASLTSRIASPFSVVVHALSTEDVVKTVNISRKHSVPIVTRGGGTGLEGSQSAVGFFTGNIQCNEVVASFFLAGGRTRVHLP